MYYWLIGNFLNGVKGLHWRRLVNSGKPAGDNRRTGARMMATRKRQAPHEWLVSRHFSIQLSCTTFVIRLPTTNTYGSSPIVPKSTQF